MANIVQSFDSLIVLNLIKICYEQSVKFYHIFDCFLINEVDYNIFIICYKKAFTNVFKNSNQYPEYVYSVFKNIENVLDDAEIDEFYFYYNDLNNNIMYDQKVWDEQVWDYLRDTVYIVTF